MLQKKERLNREKFNRFFSVGRRVHSPLFTLIYTPHPTFHGAVVVSKKVAKLAVTRNTIRRRIYAMLRTHAIHRQGGVYIVVVKKPITDATRGTVAKSIAETLSRLVPGVTQ